MEPHADKCWNRFAEPMKDDARVKNAMKTNEEFEEKVAAKRTKNEEKTVEKLAKHVKMEHQNLIHKKRGADEAHIEDEPDRRTNSKMKNGLGTSSDVNPAAGKEGPLRTHSDDVQVFSASGPNMSGDEIDELEATSKAGVEAVHKRWAEPEDSDGDEDFLWENHILGKKDGEAVKQIQIVVDTAEALDKAEVVLKEAMRDLERAWNDVHEKALDLKKVCEGR